MSIEKEILTKDPKIINIGARDFALELARQDLPVVMLNWRPPIKDEALASILDGLL